MDFRTRLNKMRAHLRAKGLSAAIFVKPINQFYLNGFETVTYSRPIWTVIDEAHCSLILPNLEVAWGKEISIADRFYPYFETPAESHMGISPLAHLEKVLDSIAPGSKIGVEMETISLGLGDRIREWGYELDDISDFLANMRAIKDPAELSIIRKAARLVCTAVSKTISAAGIGISEIEMENIGTAAAKEEASKLFPDSIVTPGLSMCMSGISRTIMPHTITGGRLLQDGDIVINTRQLALDGYYADCQRTFFVNGKRTKEQQRAYDTIVRSQEMAIGMVRPGLVIKELDFAARSVVEDAGYGACFTHRLGKSTGLEPLEEPFLRFDNEDILEPGMIINVLPSIYVPDVGGFRVSDTLLVTEAGFEVLTERCSKDLDILASQS